MNEEIYVNDDNENESETNNDDNDDNKKKNKQKEKENEKNKQKEKEDRIPLSTVMIGRVQRLPKLTKPLLCLFDTGSNGTWIN